MQMKCSYFWATLLAVALLAACSKENNNNNTTPVDTDNDQPITNLYYSVRLVKTATN